MEQAGLTPCVTESASFTYETGQAAMEHLLNDQQPTAVFASNDLIALGAIDAIKRWGYESRKTFPSLAVTTSAMHR